MHFPSTELSNFNQVHAVVNNTVKNTGVKLSYGLNTSIKQKLVAIA